MNKKALLAVFFLSGGVHLVAASQDTPSWRSAAERPERVEAPPEVGSPDITFKVDRDSLFGKPMGFAPRDEVVDPTPGVVTVQPELGSTSEPKGAVAPVNPVTPEETQPEEPTVVASLKSDPTPAKSVSDEAPVAAAKQAPTDPLESSLATKPADDSVAQQERDAVQEAAKVVPEKSVASINVPAPVTSIAKPQLPTAATLKLVRTRMVAPDYPEKAARSGEEGWVELEVTVNPNGKVGNVAVIESTPGTVFDSAARRAARQWRYEPPIDSGVDEAVTTQVRLNFVLD